MSDVFTDMAAQNLMLSEALIELELLRSRLREAEALLRESKEVTIGQWPKWAERRDAFLASGTEK